jgi:hypothetical protein
VDRHRPRPVDPFGLEELPQAGDLQRTDDGTGGGEHTHGHVLAGRATVRRGQDAEARGVEERHLPEVDGELAYIAVEQGLDVLAEDRSGGRVDLTGGGHAHGRPQDGDIDGHEVGGRGIE